MGRARLASTIALHADHLDELAPASAQFGKQLRIGCGERSRLRPDALGEQSDDRGTERIGLGQPADGARKVAELAGIDEGQRQAGTGECRRHRHLEAAGCFQHDQFGRQAAQFPDEAVEGFAIVRYGEGLVRRQDMHIKTVLRDVDTDKVRHRRRLFHDPSLRMRARFAALAIVRVPDGSGGRRAELNRGLLHPRETQAPVHQ